MLFGWWQSCGLCGVMYTTWGNVYCTCSPPPLFSPLPLCCCLSPSTQGYGQPAGSMYGQQHTPAPGSLKALMGGMGGMEAAPQPAAYGMGSYAYAQGMSQGRRRAAAAVGIAPWVGMGVAALIRAHGNKGRASAAVCSQAALVGLRWLRHLRPSRRFSLFHLTTAKPSVVGLRCFVARLAASGSCSCLARRKL